MTTPRPDPPPDWMASALQAALALKSHTRWEARKWLQSSGNRNTSRSVYAILLYDPARDQHGIYIGMSRLRPSDRYAEHRRGEGFSDVEKYHVRLLPELYRHLNPMKPREAQEMERTLCRSLRDAGIDWVSMGTKRSARKEKKQ